jgi:hypothetical protein
MTELVMMLVVYDWTGSRRMHMGPDLDGEAAGDESGWSIALSPDSDRLAIGGLMNDGDMDTAGHVRVYDMGVIKDVRVMQC